MTSDPDEVRRALQRSQEIKEMLLIGLVQVIVLSDDLIGFRFIAPMLFYCRHKIGSAAVMQEEQALAKTPQRRGAEFIPLRLALRNSVFQILSHPMDGKVGRFGFSGPRSTGACP